MHQLFDRLFQTFNAKANPIGFGAADFLELGLAILLAGLALVSRPWIEPWTARFAKRTVWCMAALALLPVGLRLALLAHHPVPSPDLNEEFGNLLIADTLSHGRLHNPSHTLPQFFEAQPSYPIGSGAIMALGSMLFGSPWAGVLLAAAAFCASCYWMLRGWTNPLWALLGGVLAVIEFGPLSSWMNTYAGGALAAASGCLVFGALPRILEFRQVRDGAVLAAGLAVHAAAQPRETVWLAIAAALFLLPGVRRLKPLWTAALSAVPVLAIALLPHAEFAELAFRARYIRFYFLPALYVTLPFFLLAIGEYQFLWALLAISVFAIGGSFEPPFHLHDSAALACVFILAGVTGLRRMPREAAWIVLALCGAHFALWYGVHVFDTREASRSLMAFETWDTLNHDNPARRIEVNRELAAQAGKQLVFVRYAPIHRAEDGWIHNAADMDAARVVWARDLGAAQDEALLRFYPDRKAWLLEPDAQPPRLAAYESVKPEAPAAPSKPPQKSPFEDVVPLEK